MTESMDSPDRQAVESSLDLEDTPYGYALLVVCGVLVLAPLWHGYVRHTKGGLFEYEFADPALQTAWPTLSEALIDMLLPAPAWWTDVLFEASMMKFVVSVTAAMLAVVLFSWLLIATLVSAYRVVMMVGVRKELRVAATAAVGVCVATLLGGLYIWLSPFVVSPARPTQLFPLTAIEGIATFSMYATLAATVCTPVCIYILKLRRV